MGLVDHCWTTEDEVVLAYQDGTVMRVCLRMREMLSKVEPQGLKEVDSIERVAANCVVVFGHGGFTLMEMGPQSFEPSATFSAPQESYSAYGGCMTSAGELIATAGDGSAFLFHEGIV